MSVIRSSTICTTCLSRTQAARSLGLDAQSPIVALLPGSRRQELRSLLPMMLAAFQRIQQRLPRRTGIIPVAPTLAMDEVQRLPDPLPHAS